MDKQAFKRQVNILGQDYSYYDIRLLEERQLADIGKLPFSIRILVENLLRKLDGRVVKEADLMAVAGWRKRYETPVEIPYHPARVLMQDFTGVPAVVDLAAMRDAVKDLGGDPGRINPLVPVDLIVDHSVQVDYYGTSQALTGNVAREYERNGERYALLKWAQKQFDNFRVVPPNSGICHQVNLEYLARIMIIDTPGGENLAYPDTLIGTDSHTTMINGIGVMGWGVGGIEAEAVMLGQPYYFSIPEVIGVRVTGALQPGVTATDLVLTVTQLLRQHGVVEKFMEYFGPGLQNLTVPDRATLANMTPEYGATMGFFPIDDQTIAYLRLTNRAEQAERVEALARATALFYTGEQEPVYTEIVELDLSLVEPSVAGPARPQDRIPLSGLKHRFAEILGCEYNRDAEMANLSKFLDESGCQTVRARTCRPLSRRMHAVDLNGAEQRLGDGSLVIAAITSCTNTSNPYVMIGAGLLARKAVERGLRVSPCVKTSLAPGSRVVERYLADAGLTPYLEALGFHLAAFGCTTCIGNSGALHPEIEKAIATHELTVAAVLSGNRNFEARIHQSVKANFLASPLLVVAFALAGRIDVDLILEPVGLDPNGEPVYLQELWPAPETVAALVQKHVQPSFFAEEYGRIFAGDRFWDALTVAESTTFQWDEASTYIRKPPYFANFARTRPQPEAVKDARALVVLGDSVTTDHISPAGAIAAQYPAGQYLQARQVAPADFNSYGSRRGNHEVMMRGTFGNIRIKNKLVTPKEGSLTVKYPENEEMYIYDAAVRYREAGVPLVLFGGREYGSGSSRDWAAKGSMLLGVRAILVESYERIHRSNLVGMGVLPLIFKAGENWESLGLTGGETFTLYGVEEMQPRKTLKVTAVKVDGTATEFEVLARLDTDIDVAYFENGGILPYVLRSLLGGRPPSPG